MERVVVQVVRELARVGRGRGVEQRACSSSEKKMGLCRPGAGGRERQSGNKAARSFSMC